MALIKEHLNPFIKKIIVSENIVKPKVRIYEGSQKGDGYISVNKALDITGSNKSVHLFLKTGPEGEKIRENGMIHATFVQEILFYEKILPSFNQFQFDSKICDKFTSTPKSYWTSSVEGKEVIALENLKNQGYVMWDRHKAINGEHVEFVFKEYAKFHGVSFAMKTNNPKLYAELTGETSDCLLNFMDTIKLIDYIEKSGKGLLQLFDPIKEKEVFEYFADFVINVRQHYTETLKADDLSVVTHGDCWCNNMMFKYQADDTTKPSIVSMRFLDFQIFRVGSVVQDISYFFYTVASKELMDNYEYYLKLYHTHINEYVKQYGIIDILSYDDLLAQWKKYSKYSLAMSIVVIKLMLSESDERKDLSDNEGKSDTIMDCFEFEGKNDAEYGRRVKLIIEHFYNNGFISNLDS